MRGNGFGDAAALACESADSRDGGSRDGVSRNITGKQPVAGMSVLPVRSEDLEQTGREHDVAIFTVKCFAETYVAATTGMPFWWHPLSKRGNITFVRLSSVRGLSGNS
jgi:hypothetical protein